MSEEQHKDDDNIQTSSNLTGHVQQTTAAPGTSTPAWTPTPISSPWLSRTSSSSSITSASASSSSSSPYPPPSSSAFPSLSASSSSKPSKRSRHAQWNHALRGPTWNPSRTRLQDLEERVLSRHLDEIGNKKKATFGMEHLDTNPDSSDAEIDNDHGGAQAQMYGLSRVTVKDLSQSGGQAGTKGKNKTKRHTLSGNGGPQIYGRHNTPYVQKGKAKGEDGDQMADLPPPSNATVFPNDDDDDDYQEEADSLSSFLNEATSNTRSIEAVIADCDRDMRAYYANLRIIQTNYLRDPIPQPYPDATFPLYEKLSRDLASPASILAADWLDPCRSQEQDIKEKLAGLDSYQDEEGSNIISRKIIIFCSRAERTARRSKGWEDKESACRVSLALLRLLHACIVLGETRDSEGALARICQSLSTLFGRHEYQAFLEQSLGTFVSIHRHKNLLQGISQRLDDLVEEYIRQGGGEAIRKQIFTIIGALRLLRHSAQSLQNRMHRPHLTPPCVFFMEALPALHDALFQDEHLRSLLHTSEYAFLHPTRYKLRLLSQDVTSNKERVRKEALYSSFYAPGRQSQSTEGQARTSLLQPGQEGNHSDSLILLIRIRREALLADTLDAFSELSERSNPSSRGASTQNPRFDPHALQHELRIHFENEEGVDSLLGGLRKEWFEEVVNELLKTETIVPVEKEEAEEHHNQERSAQFVHINPHANEDHVEALGILLGLSLYHNIPLGLRVPDYLLRFLLSGSDAPSILGSSNEYSDRGQQTLGDDCETRRHVDANLLDLAQYRPKLVQSLEEILNWIPGDPPSSSSDSGTGGGVRDDIARQLFESTYSLNWTVTLASAGGNIQTIPLIRGGGHHPVTPANRLSYVEALTNFHLYTAVRNQLSALCSGFARVWPGITESSLRSGSADGPESSGRTYLSHWHPSEVAELIQGDPTPLSVGHLRRFVEVSGRRGSQQGKEEDNTLLACFWDTLEELELLILQAAAPPGGRKKARGSIAANLLRYVTSSSTLPLAMRADTPVDIQKPKVTFTRPPSPGKPTPKRPFTIHLLDPPEESSLISSFSFSTTMTTMTNTPWPLPFSSTCTQTLFLPRYPSREILREKVGVLFRWMMDLDADDHDDEKKGEKIGEGGGSGGGFDVAFGLR